MHKMDKKENKQKKTQGPHERLHVLCADVPRGAPQKAPERERQLHGVQQKVRRTLEANDREGEEALRRDGRQGQVALRSRDERVHATGGRGRSQAQEEGPERTEASALGLLPLLSRRATRCQGHLPDVLRGRDRQGARRPMEQSAGRHEVQVRAEGDRGQATLREGDDQLQEQEGNLLNTLYYSPLSLSLSRCL